MPLPAGVEIPTTDKGFIVRAQVYRVFENEIEDAYRSLDGSSEGALKLDVPAIEEYLIRLGHQVLGPEMIAFDTDLFNFGLDSLKAVMMRASILRDLGKFKDAWSDCCLRAGQPRQSCKASP